LGGPARPPDLGSQTSQVALQEWAAANNRKPPEYELVERSGPQHLPRFEIRVSIRGVGEASAEGTSKHEAEKEAAKALMEKIG
jgi:ribonuclease-3